MFTASKVAQMSAFFANKQGGTIKVLKLIKLLYLSDRESINQHGSPISFDVLMSMQYGPVLSKTLDLLNGFVQGSDSDTWAEWFDSRDNNDVALKRKVERDSLDEISDIDLDILNSVWCSFGKMNQFQLVDYTHANCKEWKDPNGSSSLIEDRAILKALNKSEDEINEFSENIRSERILDSIFKSLH